MGKRYKIYKDCLMKTKIMVDKPKTHYNMELDIQSSFEKKEYCRSILLATNMIEAFLRRFYRLHFRIKNNGKMLTQDADNINKISLSSIVDWANCIKIKRKGKYILPVPKKKILNNKQYVLVNRLRDIRNDIAHNYYLNYDENINVRYAEKIVRSATPILSSLIKKYMKFRDNSRHLTTEQDLNETP